MKSWWALPQKIRSTIFILLFFGSIDAIIWFIYQKDPTGGSFWINGGGAIIILALVFLIIVWIAHEDANTEKIAQEKREELKNYYKNSSLDVRVVPIIRVLLPVTLIIGGFIRFIFIESAYSKWALIPALAVLILYIGLSIYQIIKNTILNSPADLTVKSIINVLVDIISVIVLILILYYLVTKFVPDIL